MQLKKFDYHLPERLIAQTPLMQRDAARLMVIDRKNETIGHDIFFNIGRYLPPESVLVLNNSKVISARLLGYKERTGGRVEILILKRLADGRSFKVLMRPTSKIRQGDQLIFNGKSLSARVVDRARKIVRFDSPDVLRRLKTIGHVPLPPYIRRADTDLDREYYQTVYARYAGSVAAPTAGLHFTKELLDNLRSDGHAIEKVMLHVNDATFRPVETVDVSQHVMHKERYAVSQKTLHNLSKARQKKRKIVAVGTTSCRVLETVAGNGQLRGETQLFIYPGYRFRSVDVLVTNFHLPVSSLLMLVYAFGSEELMKRAYREAINQDYRFYSYGDAMLIL